MLLLFITIALAIGGAVIRSIQLINSFDSGTALIAPGDHITLFIMLLSAGVVALTAGCLLYSHKFGKTFIKSSERPLGIGWFVLQFAAIGLLLAASVTDLISGFNNTANVLGTFWENIRISSIAFGSLGILSTYALFSVSLGINKKKPTVSAGFWATIPVFWSCFMLVTDFWGQAGSPVRNSFIYGTLATVCATIALYFAAGFFFRKYRPLRTLAFVLPAIFFAVTFAGGYHIATLTDGFILETLRLGSSESFRLGFIALHLTAVAWAILSGRFEKLAAEQESDDEEPAYEAPPDEESASTQSSPNSPDSEPYPEP